MRLKDKVAVITGAGQSQGRAATIMFCQEGAKVVAAGWHRENVEETVRIARGLGGDAIACLCDIRKEQQVMDMVRLAVDTYGELNVLYNNAAVDVYEGPCTEIDERTLDFTLAVNLKGHFFCCKHSIPEMIKGGGGSIINILSAGWFMPVANGRSSGDGYTMAKAGLYSLTRSIAGTFASRNIRCNAIACGLVLSAGHQKFLQKYPDQIEKAMPAYRASVGPMGKIGRPEDIVYCAIWLASDESSYVTGAHIVIDGGRTLDLGTTFEGDVIPLITEKLTW